MEIIAYIIMIVCVIIIFSPLGDADTDEGIDNPYYKRRDRDDE